MRNLHSAAEDELYPDIPAPCEELLDEASDDWAED
jgi:hypothetical protein